MASGPTIPAPAPAFPPQPGDLTTLAMAYGYLGIPAGSNDIGLQLAISAASQRMTSWCSRTLAKTDLTEIYDGTGSARLLLRNYPIVAVSSLTIDGRPIPARTGAFAPGFAHDGRRTIDLFGDAFPVARQCITVAYTAGFDPVPADLQMACLEWLKVGFLSQDRPSDLIQRKAGDTEERFAAAGVAIMVGSRSVPMPASVFAVLGQYQNVLPV